MSHHTLQQPSPLIARWQPCLSLPKVLDLACGGGRNGRPFLEAGAEVTFLDRDISGLADLDARPGAEIIQADLEDGMPFPLAGRQFDVVLVVNYLWRPILADMIATVAPGGWLIYETFALGNEVHGRPSNPNFLLKPNELLEAVLPGFEIHEFHHGLTEGPAVKQWVVARNSVSD